MYAIGRKWHRIETAGRKWLNKPEPYVGCSALYEEEDSSYMFRPNCKAIFGPIFKQVECTIGNAFNYDNSYYNTWLK